VSAYFWPPSLAQTRHVAPLVSSLLLVMYVLYIYLCKMTFDVFDCQPSPTSAVLTGPLRGTTLGPDTDASGAWIQYLQADNTPCRYVQSPSDAQVGGGTQSTLLPGAVASIIIYVVGYPLAMGGFLWKRRELIIEDQLLRAKGTGGDRLTNPNAYVTRRLYSGLYYLWKPDYYWWTCMILLRKFFIVSGARSLLWARALPRP